MKFNVIMNSATGEIIITAPDGPTEKRMRKTMREIRKMIKEDHGYAIVIKDLSEDVKERMYFEKILSKE